MQTFRVTNKQQWILLAQVLVLNIFTIVYPLVILKMTLANSTFQIVYLFVWLTDTLPSLIVHLQYWLKNHKASFTVNTTTREILYSDQDEQLRYSFNDIKRLKYFWGLGKGSGWISFSQYRYYQIIFNDNKEIFITCLMINDIDHTLEPLLRMEAERHSKLLCLM